MAAPNPMALEVFVLCGKIVIGVDANGKSFLSTGQNDRLNSSQGINGLNLNPSPSNASNGDLNSSRYTIGTSGISIASASAAAGLENGLKEINKKSYYIEEEVKNIKELHDNKGILLVLLIMGLLIIGYYHKKYAEEG